MLELDAVDLFAILVMGKGFICGNPLKILVRIVAGSNEPQCKKHQQSQKHQHRISNDYTMFLRLGHGSGSIIKFLTIPQTPSVPDGPPWPKLLLCSPFPDALRPGRCPPQCPRRPECARPTGLRHLGPGEPPSSVARSPCPDCPQNQ